MVLSMFVGSFFIHMYLMPFVMTSNIKYVQLFSLNKFYNSIFMALSMVFIQSVTESSIILTIVTLFGMHVFYFAIKYQFMVDEENYLRDMIEHHSMALQTSKQLLEKPISNETKQLALTILETQQKEIKQMQKMVEFSDMA
jgi:hypothetical protein